MLGLRGYIFEVKIPVAREFLHRPHKFASFLSVLELEEHCFKG